MTLFVVLAGVIVAGVIVAIVMLAIMTPVEPYRLSGIDPVY
jgi:hypothetical protein